MQAGEVRQRPDECGVLEQWNGVEWVEIADFAACFPPIPGPPGPPGATGASGAGGNSYPPRPTAAQPDALCNAASYILDQIRKLMSDIITDLATIEPGEILAGLLGIGGWRASALYLLVGQLDAGAGAALLEEFDDSRAALLCALVDEELSQDALLDFVETGLPASLALKDALTQAITAALDNGQYAIWAFVGSTKTDATCDDCVEEPPVEIVIEIDPGGNFLDGAWIGGTVENLGGGYWRVTGVGGQAAVSSVGYVPFVMQDIGGAMAACNGWKGPDGSFFNGCSVGWAYNGETVNRLLFAGGGAWAVTFKAVAP